MSSLPDTFYRVASARLAQHSALIHQWRGPQPDGKRTLHVPKVDESGFDVTIECENYGLFPFAEGWHGAPWDAPRAEKEEGVVEDCLGFLRSVLCTDSTLTVWYSSGKPYRWVLSYRLDGEPQRDETGSLFFNYFGRREKRVFQNRHLPPREGGSATQQRAAADVRNARG